MGGHLLIRACVLLCTLSSVVLAQVPGLPQTGGRSTDASQSQPSTAAPHRPGPLTRGEGFTIATINFEGQGVDIDFGQLQPKAAANKARKAQRKDCLQCGGLSPAGCSRLCGNRGYYYYYCDSCYCNCHNG